MAQSDSETAPEAIPAVPVENATETTATEMSAPNPFEEALAGSSEQFEAYLRDQFPQDINAGVFGQDQVPAATDDAPAAPATEPEQPSPTEPEPQTQTEPVEAPASDGDAKNWRLRPKNARDVAVFAVMKEQGLSVEEAYQQLFGTQPGANAPADQTSQAAAGENDPALPTVDELNEESKRLKADRRAAMREYDLERVAALDEQIEELEPKRAEAVARQAQAAVAADQAATQAWRDEENKTVALYPAAADSNSPLSAKIEEIAATMRTHNDPLLDRPEAVLRITQMAAAALGIAPLTGNSAPAATAPPIAPTRQQNPAQPAPARIAPASAGSAGTAGRPALTVAELDAMDHHAFEEELERRFGKI